MQIPTSFLLGPGGVPLLVLTLFAVTPGQALGQPSKPAPVEVVNTADRPIPVAPTRNAADYVTLEGFSIPSGNCSSGGAAKRVLPDGTTEAFAVPRGRVLVLTDMQGYIRPQAFTDWNASYVGYMAVLYARIENGPESQHLQARAKVDEGAVAAQVVPLEVHLQTGRAAGPGSIVCLGAQLTRILHSISADPTAQLHGYLIDQ